MKRYTSIENLKNDNLSVGERVLLDVPPYISGEYEIKDGIGCANGFSVIDLGEKRAVRYYEKHNEWCEKYPKRSFVCHKGFTGWHDFETLCTRPCSNGVYPANTFEAVEHAIRLGYRMLEIDINISKDGIWICDHEPCTMFLEGEEKNYTDLTFEEIHARPIIRNWKGGGFWHFSDTLKKECVPSLDSVLKLCKENDMFVILDTKWLKHHTYTDAEMDALAELIKKHKMENQCAAYGASFAPLTKRIPEITAAFTNIPCENEKDAAALMLSFKNVTLDVSFKQYPDVVKFAKKYDIPLTVWFTDDYRDAETAFEDGVDYLMTNSCLENPNVSDYKQIFSFSQADFKDETLVLPYKGLDLHTGDIIKLTCYAESGELKIETIDAPAPRYSIKNIKKSGNQELFYIVNDCYPYDLEVSLCKGADLAKTQILRETARGEHK